MSNSFIMTESIVVNKDALRTAQGQRLRRH